VLLIDADPMLRALLGGLLEMHEYRVRFAETSSQALTLLAKEGFDLIILEPVMQEIDSRILYQRVRAMGVVSPVVLLTTQPHSDAALELTCSGVAAVLEKPCGHELLVATLEEVL